MDLAELSGSGRYLMYVNKKGILKHTKFLSMMIDLDPCCGKNIKLIQRWRS